MRAFLLRTLILVCVLQISGAHWTVLQTAAWAGMLVTRTAQADVGTAVKTTFDGEHPCGMCLAVKAGRQQEQEGNHAAMIALQFARADFLVPQMVRAVCPAAVDFEFPSALFSARKRFAAPPSQPPRLV